jgi:hypothetical protein
MQEIASLFCDRGFSGLAGGIVSLSLSKTCTLCKWFDRLTMT